MIRYKNILFACVICFVTLQNFGQEDRNGNSSVLHQPPEVDFSWVSACLGDTTFFINGSVRGQTYKWYIYDKAMNILDSSINLNIFYVFPSADTFYVYLSADNGHQASTLEMVVIDTITTADFNFMHCSNQFMNHSTCATSFFWDFGDGSTSTSALPTHQYADTGYYNVKFIASKGIYSDTVTKQIFVDPIAFPTGAITYYLSHDTLFVHAVDSGAGMYYNWKFGDFTPNVYKRDTFHVYADTGTFIMNFSDWNTCNTAYGIDTIRYYTTASGINGYAGLTYSVSVFPDPVSVNSNLTLVCNTSLQNKAHISVCNIWGQAVFESDCNFGAGRNELKINTTDFSEGMYFIYLSGGDLNLKIKFLIEGRK